MCGVIFDLDGLLVDSEALQFKAYSQVLSRFGVMVSRAEYIAHWIAAGHGPEYAVRTYHLPMAAEELRALKDPVYHEIMREEITLMPGAAAALERLHSHFPLAVATNSNHADTTFVLDHLALRRFFQAVVTRDQYAHAKPAPDAFLTAAAQLGRPPQACVVVEDAYRGIVAAHRAGAIAIAVPNAFTCANDFSLAAAVLSSLDELTVGLIRHVLAGRGAE
jgi:HAD superfamily hydrolase (TIGR01509 family)